jgi:hypothetical protein
VKLVGLNLAVGHLEGREKVLRCPSFERGQRDRSLLAVGLGMFRGELARSLLALEDRAVRELDHCVAGRQGCPRVSIRRGHRFHIAADDFFRGRSGSILIRLHGFMYS